MAENKPVITEDIVQRIEDALEERKNKRDRRADMPAPNLGSEERRRSPGRRKDDQY